MSVHTTVQRALNNSDIFQTTVRLCLSEGGVWMDRTAHNMSYITGVWMDRTAHNMSYITGVWMDRTAHNMSYITGVWMDRTAHNMS